MNVNRRISRKRWACSSRNSGLRSTSFQKLLGTPCTAGARIARMSKFTTVQGTQFTRFFIFFTRWHDPRQVHVFSKVQKKCSKVDPNQRDLPRIIHFDHFFTTFVKSSFQNPTVLRGVSTPHTSPAKSDYFPNGRTNGRNICFWLADGRKERFAQLRC